MSMETELKKIANNLQQLTDAMVALSAVIQVHNPVVVPEGAAGLVQVDMTKTVAPVEGAVEIVTAEADTTVVDINKNIEVQTELPPLTMAEANAELQRLVGVIGDGGDSIRALLKRHNALSLNQIPAEKYAALITEAQALPAQTA